MGFSLRTGISTHCLAEVHEALIPVGVPPEPSNVVTAEAIEQTAAIR
jgi:hypothetical protein